MEKIKEKIDEEDARDTILELLIEEEIEEVFWYLEFYRNNLSDDGKIEDVEELIWYYGNNQEGLLLYRYQGLELQESPRGKSSVKDPGEKMQWKAE